MDLTIEEHCILHHLTDDPPAIPDPKWSTVNLTMKRASVRIIATSVD
jgi:hypothetical protein